MDEDIGGFEVSVQNFVMVKCLVPVDNLPEDLHRLGFAQLSLGLFVEQLLQSAGLAEFVDQVEVVEGFHRVEVFYHVQVVDLLQLNYLVVRQVRKLRNLFEF